MATQIVIGNGSYIKVDDSYHIDWADKGNAMPAIPNTLHALIWNNLSGQNEIQSKDASTGMMTGNTNLSSTSDAVGSTTVGALLTWAETRKGEIETAKTAYINDGNGDVGTGSEGKTWIDYDSNYS
tara:strand:- start:258 stop:635 length:378 start_codon:yes stop_codon:yes gene_type:complete